VTARPAAPQAPPGASEADLDTTIRLVRRRWRLRVALGGVAVLVLAALAALVVGAYAMEQARFTPASVLAARGLVALAVAAAGWRYLARPALRPVPDARVALYLEEREPSFGAALLSAVEVRGAAGAPASPAIARRLVADAAALARAVDFGRRVERAPLRRGAAAALGASLCAAALLMIGPAFVRSGARAVFWPFGHETAAAATPAARVTVRPGDAQVPRGGDLSVHAALEHVSADEVVVLLRRGAAAEWERVPMTPGAGGASAGAYTTRLLDLDSAAQYRVEAGEVRSPAYTIRVVDRPFARRVALEYRFPAYTGLAAQRVDDGGDVAAVRGTAVVVRVTPSAPARAGRLVVGGGVSVPLVPGDSGTLVGTLRVDRPGSYHVELAGADGVPATASLDYVIDVLPDRPPTVTVAEPGRDVRVTRLEEVFTSVEAEDDYGVARVDLVYTVNGGPEQTVALHAAGARRTPEVSAGHTFFLEELPLRPGDVVSYYARARDNDAVGGAHAASTDIYFLTVRPFGQTYRQAEQQGGGGQGGEESPNALSERQRQIVAATHKLVRDSAATPERQRREDLTTLALGQSRLRDQVNQLAQRVQQRGALSGDTSVRAIAEALPLAAAEMRSAEEQLGRRRPADALPAEQRALQQLQRAEAAFREVQVSVGGSSSPGGGGGATPEELADLFGLDADRLRNQYEAVQRGGAERQAASAEVDRTLERLRELAQRQQRESERARREDEAMRQALGAQAGGGGGGGDAQRQLAQETEQLARQLERLAREAPSPAEQQGAQQSARQLQAAADEMRRAAAGTSEAAAAAAATARARLEAARQRLAAGREAEGERGVAEARRRAAALAAEQRRVGGDAERLARGEGRGGAAERQLDERKAALDSGVGALEADLDRLAREMRRAQPEAARRMQGAADAIREGQLRERLRFSREVARRGSPEYARNLEQQIAAALDDVRQRVDSAATAVRAPAGRAGSQAVDRARELARGVESMGERMQQRREAARGGQAGAQPGGQGQTGASGQPGARPGQQGGGQGGRAGGQGAAVAQGGAPQAGTPGGGSPGGQSSPGAGGRSSGGSGAGGGSARPGALSPNDVRQFAREMAARRADAEALRQGLARQGLATGELQALIGRMRALESQRVYDDPEEAARLQAAVADGLKAFEFALRRRLDGASPDHVRLGAGDDVPAGFRALVEEYYRALARGGR
jgi:hypothetical protein